APLLSPDAEAAYRAFLDDDYFARAFAEQGAMLVDGADPVFELVEDPRSARPGTVPYADAPRLVRRDFVSNANESYWLANPHAPLTGYPMVYGETGTPRSARTRMNNAYLLEGDEASGPDGRFSLDELEAAALSGRGMLAELLR